MNNDAIDMPIGVYQELKHEFWINGVLDSNEMLDVFKIVFF